MGLRIDKENLTFTKNGEHFFFLADTCWSAFTNIDESEWLYYLDYRKTQGFNTLQINILPQWDASSSKLDLHPFKVEDGKYVYSSFNDSYFENAAKLCSLAVQKGFELALVVLWCNYIPDTWASKMSNKNIMPYSFIETYINKVHEVFTIFDPIYIISGDTDFNSEQPIQYYLKASTLLRALACDQLQTFHIKGRSTDLPEILCKQSDFIMFQSGHNGKPENQNQAITLADYFYKNIKKLCINSEPCYEQMGYSGQVYGRFYEFEVRRAAWFSLLSGAYAGITYGAAGIYNWHHYDQSFDASIGEGFSTPPPWNEALLFQGAWDYAYIKHLFKSNTIQKLVPNNTLLKQSETQICCASNEGETLFFIYLPVNTKLFFNQNMETYDVIVYDLEDRRIGYPTFLKSQIVSYLDVHNFKRDVLIKIEKHKHV